MLRSDYLRVIRLASHRGSWHTVRSYIFSLIQVVNANQMSVRRASVRRDNKALCI